MPLSVPTMGSVEDFSIIGVEHHGGRRLRKRENYAVLRVESAVNVLAEVVMRSHLQGFQINDRDIVLSRCPRKDGVAIARGLFRRAIRSNVPTIDPSLAASPSRWVGCD